MIKKIIKIKTLLLILLFLLYFPFFSTFNVNAEKAELTDKSKQEYYTLRDDYVIFNGFQYYVSGLCWNFAAMKSLETSLMVNTDEMYDFSEASIAIYPDSYYNDITRGGYFATFDRNLRNYGILFESDFRYDEIFSIPNKGYYLNAMKEFYNKKKVPNIDKKVKEISYRYDQIDEIKNHIVNNGSLYISIENFDEKENNRKEYKNDFYKMYEIAEGNYGKHAVAVIGWDDNYISVNGKKGAFIIINSSIYPFLNPFGINYLPYDTKPFSKNEIFKGYKYIDKKIIESNSNSKFKNQFSGFYNSKNPFNKRNDKIAKNKNMFYTTDSIVMKYNINSSLATAHDISTSVFFDSENVTNLFDLSNENKNSITLKAKSFLKPGSYKVKIRYSYTDLEDNNIKTSEEYRQIFVFDGTESILSYSKIANVNHELFVGFNTYSLNTKIPVVLMYKDDKYALHDDILYTFDSGKIKYKIGDKEFKFNFNNYNLISNSEDEYILNLDVYKDDKKVSTRRIQFYKIHDNLNYIFAKVFYFLDGAKVENLISEIPLSNSGKLSKRYLENPTKENHKFLKYNYIDKFGNEHTLPYDPNLNKYYIDYNVVLNNKQEYKDLNHFSKTYLTNSYPIIVKPVFVPILENNNLIFDYQNVKNHYTALETIDISKINLTIKVNNENHVVKPSKVIYENDNHITYRDTKITFELFFKENKYNVEIPIQVNKILVDVKIAEDSHNLFIYDSKPHQLKLSSNVDLNLLSVDNLPKIDAGKYSSIVGITNPNYTFENNKTEKVFDFEIKQRRISETSIKNKNKNKLNFDFPVLVSYDDVDFFPYLSFNEMEKPKGKYLYFKYVAQEGKNNFMDVSYRYKLQGIEQFKNQYDKEIIDILLINNQFEFNGKMQTLEFNTPIDLSNFIIKEDSKIDVGNYVASIEIKNIEKYIFLNNRTKLTFNWNILKKKLRSDSIVSKTKDKLIFDYPVFVSYDNIEFFEYVDFRNMNKPIEKYLYFKYKDNSNLEDNFYKYILTGEENFKPKVKQIVNISLPKNTFEFNGSTYELLFNSTVDLSNFIITNNINKNSGTYKALIEIKDKEKFIFENNLYIKEFLWKITPKKLSLNSFVKIGDNLVFDSDVLYSYDRIKFYEFKEIATIEKPTNNKLYFKYKEKTNYDSTNVFEIDVSNLKFKEKNTKFENNNFVIKIIAVIFSLSIIIIIFIANFFYIKRRQK